MMLVWCLEDLEGNRLKNTKWHFERAQRHKMLGEAGGEREGSSAHV